ISAQKAPRQRTTPDGRVLPRQNGERRTKASLPPIRVVTAKATATDPLITAKTMRSGRREATTVIVVICAVTPPTHTETARSLENLRL
ncbi:hypothetical protein HAX54_015115, partial [Datura stramonium]|nr:hypothetical protein [Datura stramonium]